MKKLTALLIAGAMCISLVACGRDESSPEPNAAAPAVNDEVTEVANGNDGCYDDDEFDAEAYTEGMLGIVKSVGSHLELFVELMDAATEIKDAEGFAIWMEAFEITRDTFKDVSKMLGELTDELPVEFSEGHNCIVGALQLLYEALNAFGNGIEAGIEDNEDGFDEGMKIFEEKYNEATELWDLGLDAFGV